MICQNCLRDAPTKYVEFHQNIGALVIRFPKSIEGHLCKTCIHNKFWGMTTITLFLGWWGMISLIVTPFFLLNNIGRYLTCLGMPAVPPDAAPPSLNNDVVEQINPHVPELFSRLNAGENFAAVASQIAERAGVTSGQVAFFVHMVAQSQARG
jgi:hypothetical protein